MYFVRTAGERDIGAVSVLMTEALHGAFNTLLAADEVESLIAAETSVATLTQALKAKGGEFLVADSGRDLGGMGYACMSADFAKTAEIRWLLVRPSLQRQGIGRDIFAELESCFPDAEILRLEIDARNRAALAFFNAHGMVEIDRIERAGGPSPLTLVLEKPLGDA